MTSNYKDIYYRHNPRNSKGCNPLYIDNYKRFMEPFENMKENKENNIKNIKNNIKNKENNIKHKENNIKNKENNIKHKENNIENNIKNEENGDFKISGGNYEDNYSYLNLDDNKVLLCDKGRHILEEKGVKKMYDLKLESLMERKQNGEINNIDMMHNNKILKSMNYNNSNILATQKISNRLMRTLNNKVIDSNKFATLEDPFFSHKEHNNYKWKNTYFKNSNDKNIKGKWWTFKEANVKPLDFRTVIDYRTKKPAKVNFDRIQYKNKK